VDGPQLRWELDTAQSALVAACCFALVDVIERFGSDHRLGTCGAERCDDVYIDRSQAATRRYCSLTCQNRTRVMSHRARTARRRGAL
jgi:predicted RNA-binding Zn ribbon-like protein